MTEAPNEGGNDRGKAIAPGDNRGIITPDVVPRTAHRYILQAGAKIAGDAHTEEQKGCRATANCRHTSISEVLPARPPEIVSLYINVSPSPRT